MSRDPDFLIVGAARSGTTALCRMLQQHPQVYLPVVKEPCFYCFVRNKPDYKKGKFAFAVTDPVKYQRLFDKAGKKPVTGEASTPYLYLHETTIANIKAYHANSDELKIVIILRHPVERAFSNYMWRVRDGRESLSFEEALAAEPHRMQEGYSFDYFYAHRSLYFDAVKDYFENFSKVNVILYDDFVADSTKTMTELCEFLEIDHRFGFEKVFEVNAAYSARWPWLSRLITTESPLKFKILYRLAPGFRDRLRKVVMSFTRTKVKEVQITPETRKRLSTYFRSDIEKLAELLQRDLSHWLH